MACTSNQSPELLPLAHFVTSPSGSAILKGLSPFSLSTAAKYELEKLGHPDNSSTNVYNQPNDILEELSLTDDLKRSLVDACQVLKKLKNGNTFVYREAITAIKELRRLAVEQFSNGKFSEALILAHQSLSLGRQYHGSLNNVMLTSEMSTELYIIAHCFAKADKLESGLPFLKELRYLVEMAIRGDGKISSDKLPHLTYLVAKLYTAYNDQQASNLFFYKYIELIKSQKQDSKKSEAEHKIELCDALQRVCVEMVACRQYERALELATEVLEIRISIYGDFKCQNPKVADAYCNVGLLYRLNGNPVDGLHKLICGLDMHMRIHKNRNHPKVQNALLSIACCYHVMGDLTSSYNLYSEVFATRQLSLGVNHPSTKSVQKLLNKCTPKAPAPDMPIVATSNTGTVAERLKNVLFKPEIEYSFRTPYKNYPVLPQLHRFTPSYYSVCSQYFDKYPPSKTFTAGGAKILPFVNVPHLSCGQATLDGSGEPVMELSSEGEELLSSWGIKGVKVSPNGEVTVPSLTGRVAGLKVVIPYVKDGELLLGYHGRHLYLPNPAIAHIDDFSFQPAEIPTDAEVSTASEKLPDTDAKVSTASEKLPDTDAKVSTASGKLPDTDAKVSVVDGHGPVGKHESVEEAKLTSRQKFGVTRSILKKLTRSFSKAEAAPTTQPAAGSGSSNDSGEASGKNESYEERSPVQEEESVSLESKLGSFSAKIGSLAEALKTCKVPANTFRPVVRRTPSHLTAIPTVSVHSDILQLNSLKDRLPLEVACKVFAISTIPKSGANSNSHTTGSYLMDKDLVPIVQVPWQIDLTMLKMTAKAVKKTSLLEYEFASASDSARLVYAKAMEGDGLRELGFGKPLSPYHEQDLDFGVLHIPETALKKFVPKPSSQSPRLGVTKAVTKKAMPTPKGKGKFGMKAPPKSMPPVSTKKASAGVFKDTGKNRRFFWDPIFGDDAKGTMFEDMKFDQIHIEKSVVEDTFAKAPPKEKSSVPKQTIIQLLPNPKRSYNMNIALSKFSNYTFHEMRQAIINLDADILNAEATESLLNFTPTSEELSIMKEYVDSGGDLTRVDRPEQFVAAMIGIPLLQNRLDAHYVALCFRERYEEIMTPLNNLSEACDTVINSQKLKAFSMAILRIGNAINEGDPKKGNATGFRATTFNKLVEFKTTTKPIRTLLRYIIDSIATYDEDTVNNLYADMLICEKAIRVDVPTVEGNIAKLVASFNKIQLAVSEAKKLNDPLAEIMKEFVEQVETRVSALSDNFKEVMDHFREMAGYLGYGDNELKKLTPEEVFGTLWNFAKNVETTRKIRKDEIERQARKDAAEQKKKMQPQSEAKTSATKTKYTKAQPKILTNKLDDTLKRL